MKTFFSTLLVVALLFIGNLNLQAQSNLIRNAEEVDGLIVSETVFKMESNTLTNYMKHLYKYDDNKQRIEDEVMNWNGVKEEWEKDRCMRYTYTETSVTTEYYTWNKKKKEYILVPEMTITMDK